MVCRRICFAAVLLSTLLLGTGPVVGTRVLDNPASLNPGGTDYLAITISLPTSADNTFQGKSAALSLTFTGTQRTGTAR